MWMGGLVQIWTGVWLEMYASTCVGSCLALQGSLDIVSAIRSAVGGTFSWKEFVLDKLAGLPFTVLCVAAERWLHGVAENAFSTRTVARTAARRVVRVCARGVCAVALGKVLRAAKDATLENFGDEIASRIDAAFAPEFADVRADVEDLCRSNSPDDAEKLISDALDGVVARADDDDAGYLGRLSAAGVEFLPTAIELALLSTTQDVDDRTRDCVRFAAIVATSLAESRRFARNALRSLREVISSLRRARASGTRGVLRPRQAEGWAVWEEPADAQKVDEFAARFQRRVARFVARKVGERCRRGLMQATAQSFIVSGVASVADVAGF